MKTTVLKIIRGNLAKTGIYCESSYETIIRYLSTEDIKDKNKKKSIQNIHE
jgi:hypothetical protein